LNADKESRAGEDLQKLKLSVRSTKHQYGWFVFEGRKILRVHFSHGKGDVPGKVSDKIRSQLRLTQNDFMALINCPLSLSDYTAILKGKGLMD